MAGAWEREKGVVVVGVEGADTFILSGVREGMEVRAAVRARAPATPPAQNPATDPLRAAAPLTPTSLSWSTKESWES